MTVFVIVLTIIVLGVYAIVSGNKPPPEHCPKCGGDWTRVNDGGLHMANGWLLVCKHCNPEDVPDFGPEDRVY